MHTRRQILKSAATLGMALTAYSPFSALARSVKIEGFHQQDWFHNTSFDLKKDLEAAKQNNKILTLLWEQKGCSYCKKMHEIVFQRDDVADLIKKEFLVIQMDMWGDREFRNFDGEKIAETEMAQNYLVRGTPTTLFFDDIGAVVFRMPGYGEPPVFKAVFRYVHGRIYEKQSFFKWIKTQQID